jgi:acyl dehydratase
MPGETRRLVLTDDLTRTQIVQYAGASGDYNPLHTDERFAHEVAGYPTVFAHGMLTMGMAGRVLTDWFGSDAILEYGVRFVAQVWPGDRLTATAVVNECSERDSSPIAILSVEVANQAEVVVLTGTATVRTE